MPELRRVAVLNRGEAAVRFLRAVQDYNQVRDTSIVPVLFFTEADATAPFVVATAETVRLGPATRPGAGGATISAYCDVPHVLALLRRHACDALWPGWGFASEDFAFAEALERAGITFIGPPSGAMRALGDKIPSRRLAEAAGLPVAPWAEVPAQTSPAELAALAEPVGFPMMVKASAGGGGRGIRRVEDPGDLAAAVDSVRAEARRSFGAGSVLLERYVQGSRHVEVQVVVDARGRASTLGVRDCSIQRRHQKILEETPSPVLPEDIALEIQKGSARLTAEAGYRGAGTVEFLYDPGARRAWFLEVNARLQVEHPITELVSGADLVFAQIDVARGLSWEPPAVAPGGHAIEVRLNAEDPDQAFQPTPGVVQLLNMPAGPGIRVDSGVEQGSRIPPDFDSMIAKVIAWGPDRRTALARLWRALRGFDVVVRDGATNKGFLLELLRRPEVIDATADTRWVDREAEAGAFGRDDHAIEALSVAAVVEYETRRHLAEQKFLRQVHQGIPHRVPMPDDDAIELRLRGAAARFEVWAAGDHRYLVSDGERVEEIRAEPAGPSTAVIGYRGEHHRVLYARQRNGVLVEVDGAAYPVTYRVGGRVLASSPAMVVHVAVDVGQEVSAGDRLCTLEAMKTEIPVHATEAGAVRAVVCRAGMQVVAGQPLMMLEPHGAEDAGSEGGATWRLPAGPASIWEEILGRRIALAAVDAMAEGEAARAVDRLRDVLRAVLLGYPGPEGVAEALAELLGDRAAASVLAHPARMRPLLDFLQAFADVEDLFVRSLLAPVDGAPALSPEWCFYDFCRRHPEGAEGVAPPIDGPLQRALSWYGVAKLDDHATVRDALWRMAVAHGDGVRRHRLCAALLRLAMGLRDAGLPFGAGDPLRGVIARIARLTHPSFPALLDHARQASYELFTRARFLRGRQEGQRIAAELISRGAELAELISPAARDILRQVAEVPHALLPGMLKKLRPESPTILWWSAAVLHRLYVGHTIDLGEAVAAGGSTRLAATVRSPDTARRVRLHICRPADAAALLTASLRDLSEDGCRVELVFPGEISAPPLDAVEEALQGEEALRGGGPAGSALPHRVTVSWTADGEALRACTWRWRGGRVVRDQLLRDVHPEVARRVELRRLEAFDLQRLEAPDPVLAFFGRARTHPEDERIFVFAEIRDLPEHLGEAEHGDLWEFEQLFYEGVRVIREAQARRERRTRFHWNRMTFVVRPILVADSAGISHVSRLFESATRSLGLEKVVVRARVRDPRAELGWRLAEFVVYTRTQGQIAIREREPAHAPLRPMTPHELRVVRARRLGLMYPYEIAWMLTGKHQVSLTAHPDMAQGRFTELDLDDSGSRLVAVRRPPGESTSAVVVGVMSHATAKIPEGMERVWVASDPTHAMGALAEPECRRIIAAIDLAEQRGLPVEWVAVSAGALIAMDSGTENLDWTARVLRRIVEFSQAGGAIHMIVPGVNVGAQSYWNAEATMLMHTRGLLILTAEGSMVLTGKRALEVSGSVSAEDERGIGGYERIMGPNGQAQIQAADLGEAYAILFDHYNHSYVRPGEPGPRTRPTSDPVDRSVLDHPCASSEGFQRVGEIFGEEQNPGRKRPFSIRDVMAAVVDQDSPPMERWRDVKDGETAVVWDAHVGGFPVCLLGVESRSVTRVGAVPIDGPEVLSAATLFPRSAWKVARAINQASGNRPVVVLANLSGFDGSPESMRRLQLEYGAEIGRAVVNFKGPFVFVVIGRYHGGAYVVFSKALNPEITALALEGSYASVIGGGPAAAVVLPRLVRKRAASDPRILALRGELAAAPAGRRPALRERLHALLVDVGLEKQAEVAREFDAIHNVERAIRVGSLDAVIPPARLRPAIVEALRDGRGHG